MNARVNTTLARLFSIDLLLALALSVLAFSVFAFIAHEIVLQQKGAFDTAVFTALAPYTSPRHTQLALVITFFGSGSFLFPVYVVILIYLLKTKQRKYAAMILAVELVSMLLGFGLKVVFHRPRPLLEHLTPAIGYSFPSGHSVGASTLCGLLLYMVWKSRWKGYVKALLSVALLCFAFLVGLSRVYLHVHFASDVLAGFCVTVVWLSLFFIGMELVAVRNNSV